MSNNKKTKAHYIHRLSYSAREQLVGAFVLVAVALLVWLLITSQKTQDLFEEEIILYGTMNSPQAINKDTNIIISGLTIGKITAVNIDDNNHMMVNMSILKKYQKLIRTDSTAALLNFQFAQLGKSVIEITVGSPQLPIIQAGSTLVIKESFNLVKLVSQFEPALHTLQDSIRKMDEILQVIDSQKIDNNISNLESISHDMKAITHQVRQGKGVAGNVIFNNQMQRDVIASTENLKDITDKTIEITDKAIPLIEQTKKLLHNTQKLLHSIQLQVNDMPEITEKVKPLLDEANKTLKATQQIWPLSSSIPKENKQTLTTPEATE